MYLSYSAQSAVLPILKIVGASFLASSDLSVVLYYPSAAVTTVTFTPVSSVYFSARSCHA